MHNYTNNGNRTASAGFFNKLLSKLTQSPTVYPIKFYMKGTRMRRRFMYMAK